MIGYHYTTREAYRDIQLEGLYPSALRKHEYDKFSQIMPRLCREAIWLWKEKLSKVHAWIVTVTLAVNHDSFDLVLLKVEYDKENAVSIIHANGDTIKLKCSFSAHSLSTGSLPIELLMDPVSPKDIELIWEGDLLSPLGEE